MKPTSTVANHIISAVLSHVRNNKDPLPALHVRDRNPFAADATALKTSEGGPNSPEHAPNIDTSVLHLGIDWGATKTVLKGSYAGSGEVHVELAIPTVLGFVKEGLIDSIAAENGDTLCGHDALTHRRHLQLTHPTLESEHAAEFARHLRSAIKIASETEIRAVLAVPANFDATLREHFRRSIAERFESIILLPAPYLTALAYSESQPLETPSVLIDLGAARTTVCFFDGAYRGAEEMPTIDFGGNHIDQNLRAAILEKYPEAELSPITVRLLKEKHACAGRPAKPIETEIVLGGSPAVVDITAEITATSGELMNRIHTAVKELLSCEGSHFPLHRLQVILTGGGSRMKNIAEELQRLLTADDFGDVQVDVASDKPKHLVALGALRAAQQARPHQWQQVLR